MSYDNKLQEVLEDKKPCSSTYSELVHLAVIFRRVLKMKRGSREGGLSSKGKSRMIEQYWSR